jgi:hypothetical protein
MAKAVITHEERENWAVSDLISDLDHPFRSEVAELRKLILGSDERITEKIKWNAPSFCWDGEDRVTFKLQPRDCFQIVFHRGAKRSSEDGVVVSDPKGLLKWAAADRAVATVQDTEYFKTHKQDLLELVLNWMRSA